MPSRKRLLVSGHLGFIGSAFCHAFAGRFDIVGVDFGGWGSMAENLAPDVGHVDADIADDDRIAAVVDDARPDAIVNFAAESHVDRSLDDDSAFWRSNVFGARNLARAAKRRGIRLVHVSTDEVYGDAADAGQAWTEGTPISPRNPYAVTKAAAEMMLLAYAETDGLDVVVTRGSNTIGPRQFPEKAVPKAVACFGSGQPFPLFRTPARRMWMHVDDHAAGICAALDGGRAGEVYNLAPAAGNEAYTHDVIERVRDLVGGGSIEAVDDRSGYDLRYWMKADKAADELGWTATRDLEQTLAETVAWYTEHPDWLDAACRRLAAAA